MWCQHCQQDVPAMSAAAGLPMECPRCQQKVARAESGAPQAAAATTVEPSAEWTTEQRMKQIGRSLRTPLTVASSAGHDGALHWVDVVPREHHAAPAHEMHRKREAHRAKKSRRRSQRRTQVVAWLALVFGLGLAAGGVGLMGIGMFGEQPIFWMWGVGVTLAGQAALIAGLIHVLVTLWGSNRAASRRLVDMQEELAEVGRTAESILAQRPGGPSGFYGELARGASPALLLANLKGQIDHLATRLHHDV